MEGLANAFSVLELDAQEDDQARTSSSSVDSKAQRSASGDSGLVGLVKVCHTKSYRLIDAGVGDKEAKSMAKIENHNNQEKQDTPPAEYRLPLVWIDLEMTGLDIEVDRILEIACIITDGNLAKSVEGPDLVIHQSEECLDRMGEWCRYHHAASGLTEKVLHSTISEKEAEKQVIDFVKKNVGTYTPHLAGNSVYVDFMFLKKYMPDLASLFSHVVIDVSSVKALCIRWYPRDQKKAPAKKSKHRAMDDIRESILELKYYKENIFKSKPKR